MTGRASWGCSHVQAQQRKAQPPRQDAAVAVGEIVVTHPNPEQHVQALDKLLQAAEEVQRYGAQTGPQWVRLTGAIMKARSDLAKMLSTPPAPAEPQDPDRAAFEPSPAGYIHPDNVYRLENGDTVAFRKKPYDREQQIPVYVGTPPSRQPAHAVEKLIAAWDKYQTWPFTENDRLAFVAAIENVKAAYSPPPQQPAQGWQDIATASEGNLVVVYWEDPTDSANPERYDFDYLEDGTWMNHHDRYEHMLIAGAHGLKEKAPYTHWMALGKPGINFALGTEPAQGQDAKEPERFVVLKASGSRYACVNDTLLGKTVKRYDVLRGGWINAELHAARLNRDAAMTAAQGDVVQGGGK